MGTNNIFLLFELSFIEWGFPKDRGRSPMYRIPSPASIPASVPPSLKPNYPQLSLLRCDNFPKLIAVQIFSGPTSIFLVHSAVLHLKDTLGTQLCHPYSLRLSGFRTISGNHGYLKSEVKRIAFCFLEGMGPMAPETQFPPEELFLQGDTSISQGDKARNRNGKETGP
ncbi:hypothetical protein JEQ12_000165 [Ovis aries]|uniref:Uncharacterized protein n=1 Tax=Ovis aries TaxID=9940 RepID=A0A836AL33_SHEEP|nr:hypothetical protein JEQ12_000165 [Ovis aries]